MRSAAAGAGTALGATVLVAPAAEAATFTVTSLDDSTADGTLRGEVINANTAAGDDVIVFAAGLSGTITLDDPEGDIEIAGGGLEIQGPGAGTITVDGNNAQRIFYLHNFIAPGEEVVLSGLTMTRGYTADEGGAVHGDDDSDYAANLTISDAVLTANNSDSFGGAVTTDDGHLAIIDSTLTQNSSGQGAGAVFVRDTYLPATPGETHVTIEGSTLSGNHADGWGGALYLESPDGDALITGSTLSGNTTDSGGGAMDVVGVYGGGDLIIDQTTISGNTSVDEGGGANLDGIEGDTVIRNSTISGNTVSDLYGGGAIYFEDADTGTDPVIRNSTIARNSTAGQGGAIYLDEGGPVRIVSSIVADNSASDGDLSEDTSNAPAGFELGFSLVEDAGGNGTIVESPAGSDLLGVDPQLGPLAANGGPTETQLPAVTSPAVDAGIADGLTTDQRGLARTADLSSAPNAPGSDATDIGSVEIQSADCQGTFVPSITGTGGDDALTGTEGADAIAGLAGNDAASGLGGDDCISGDEDKDKLTGGAGKDQVSGGAGKDSASGQGGKDNLKGEAGKDALRGGGGKDKLNGAGGKDRLSGGGGKDKLKGGPGKDKITTGGGRDKVNCGAGNDTVNADAKDKVAANCETVT